MIDAELVIRKRAPVRPGWRLKGKLPVQHFITQYSYLAVFLLMLAESACIPVPSEVIAARGRTGRGRHPGAHPSLAGLAAGVGNVAGSYVAWAGGRYAGLAAARRWGRRVGIREREIDRAAGGSSGTGQPRCCLAVSFPWSARSSAARGVRRHAGWPVRPVHRAWLHPLDGGPGHRGLRARRQLGERRQRLPRPHLRNRGIIAVALVAAVIMHFRRGRRNGVGGPESDVHDDAQRDQVRGGQPPACRPPGAGVGQRPPVKPE